MAGRKKAIDPAARFSATQPLQKVVALNWNRAIKDKSAFRKAIRNAISAKYASDSPLVILGFHASLLRVMQAIGEESLAMTQGYMKFECWDEEVKGILPQPYGFENYTCTLSSVWNSSMLEVVTQVNNSTVDEREAYLAIVKCALAILCLQFYSDSESLIASHTMCHVEHPMRFCTTAALTMFCTLAEIEFDPD